MSPAAEAAGTQCFQNWTTGESMEQQQYLEKVYGGLVGKCVGVRLGAPVEPTIWTYERIRETYGDITGYIKEYSLFAADDDINGPMFFIRSLLDHPSPISAADVGDAWLNYTREGIGFYWWGGYGTSTEHTAYLNLKSGLKAPLSGSMEVNGTTIAEQIGGQIFIDSWGWVYPGDFRKAADMAGMASSVGHDRNGIYGARFIAACISLAFEEQSISRIVELALETIPEESTYAQVVRAVRSFHREHPRSWREAREYLEKNWGYDRYPGVCHIIPNAGVCVLALFYGEGDFNRTVEIATMSGWDTDCNAGNVGSILGVMNGIEGIGEHYLRPINDWHAASSIAGALNSINLPTAAKELAVLGRRQAGLEVPREWQESTFTDDIILDFSLPFSTGGLRTSSDFLAPLAPGSHYRDKGSLTVLLDRLQRGDSAYIYYQSYYTREDFSDERYSPTFTPEVYSGQTLTVTGQIERMSGQRIAIAPYIADAREGRIESGQFIFPAESEEFTITYTVPAVPFAIKEVGLQVMNPDAAKFLGTMKITSFRVTGKRSFRVEFKDEKKEFRGLSRCSLASGAWELEDGGLRVITNDTFQLYSGPYYTKDSTVTATVQAEYGESHMIIARSRGAQGGYYFGLHGNDTVALIRRSGENLVLSSVPFPWKKGKPYTLSLSLTGDTVTGSVDGQELIRYQDSAPLEYGMAGLGKLSAGRTLFFSLEVKEE